MIFDDKLHFLFIRLLSLPILLCLSFSSYAETVSHKLLHSQNIAEADYKEGQANKPAILIVHGFLTTNKFHTVATMSKSLQEEGYTTLAPTLTLGINKRKNSIKCNSIHTHTLESDVNEIEDWVNWLVAKGYNKIILIGHSSGSQELVEYLSTKSNAHIEGAIFTSLFYFKGKELGTLKNEIVYAQDLIERNQHYPYKYSFLFCKNNYSATPESYLSYLKLDKRYVLNSLKHLKIPNYTIMGSADKRYQKVGKAWLNDLKKTGSHVIEVKGANHFFSSEHEFDLQDIIIKIISDIDSAGKHVH
ncbi:hypothetical protein JCM30760_18230 [Thiomicrorhabdus hydrogeniphila]